MKRRIGALLAAGALLLTFASTALATVENTYDWQKDGNGQGWPNETCTDGSASMLWVWTGDNPTSLTINDELQSGSWVEMGGGAWHFTTDVDGTNYPPTSAWITYTGAAGVLTLSHCDGTQPTPTPSVPVQSESLPPTASPSPSDSPTPSPSDSPTPSPSDSPTPSPSDSPTPSITDGPTPTPSLPVQSESVPPSQSASPSATPSGSVLAETGTPRITPPSTDTVSGTSGTGGSGLPMVLAAISVLLLAVLVATPARKRSRR